MKNRGITIDSRSKTKITPCYLVILLSCYLVILLSCYLVILLSCYLVILLSSMYFRMTYVE
ncbi:hypothetical protein C9105_23655 (plasmid) [Escherichia coli]|nr:hypothetical protein [Escherichia coli]QCH54002.1 hypothetical protein C8201_25795 [Escherichia coli O113:H21]MBW9688901.1 hypothetical protein [Escherichia coli]TFX70505.1 hypothetical protein DEO00_24855 [Escherichia coli]TJJ81156.1 hypothetical protein C9100_24285 [Escherichia coli]